MISIQQISLHLEHSKSELKDKIVELLGLAFEDLQGFTITKRAIDSRKKRQMIYFVYSVDVEVENEEDVIKNKTVQGNLEHHRIKIKEPYTYEIPNVDSSKVKSRPIVIGAGPSGMFSALLLAKAGLKPIIIERGGDIDSRISDVDRFLASGKLNTESNIQFGEGGAGTFSDGKLNTLITNPRIKYVFDTFVDAGAPDDILWDAKPHIGTDKIRNMTKNIRKETEELGGEFRFNTKLTDIKITKNKVVGITVNEDEEIKTDTLVLAIGYSARDTYKMLFDKKLDIEQKSFSIGVRIEHRAEMINRAQYDEFYDNKKLGTAKYKLVNHSKDNRTVYTFCMCPGGYIMPSTAQEGCVVTNGMSKYAQDGENSNSALLVNVGSEDFGSDHPLAGMEFQEKLERKAFEAGGSNYNAPVQLVGDFLSEYRSNKIKSVVPSYKPGVKLTSLDECLPDYVIKSLREALPKLENKIKGFSHPDAVLTGIETRSSSPVRIIRDTETLESNISGIYPSGEGAGYAGGIVSSAVDGMRVAELILNKL